MKCRGRFNGLKLSFHTASRWSQRQVALRFHFLRLAPAWLILLCLGLLSLAGIIVNVQRGGGTAWGYAMGLIPAIGGSLALFLFMFTAGGVPVVYYAVAALPIVGGFVSLYFWGCPREGWLRIVLYGCFAFAGACFFVYAASILLR